MKRVTTIVALGALAIATATSSIAQDPAPGAGPTDADLIASDTNPQAVLTNGMGPRAQRFS